MGCAAETDSVFQGLPYDPASGEIVLSREGVVTSGSRFAQLGAFVGLHAQQVPQPTGPMCLDLRPGSRIMVTQGNFAGCVGVVSGQNAEGHFLLIVKMSVAGLQHQFIEEDLLLGSWWLQEAREGLVACLPIVQATV